MIDGEDRFSEEEARAYTRLRGIAIRFQLGDQRALSDLMEQESYWRISGNGSPAYNAGRRFGFKNHPTDMPQKRG